MAQVTKEEAYIIGAAQKRFREEYRKKKRNERIKSKVLWAAFLVIVSVVVFNTGLLVYEYHGSGMSAVCSDGDIVITNRLAFLVNKPERGEIITTKRDGQLDLKRVVGLPGDTIDFENGDVYINDMQCIESYVTGQTEAEVTHLTVSEGSYYVLNDDRDDMEDSRTYEVTSGSIQGSKLAVIHIPDFVQSNEVYQAVRDFCKSGAEVTGSVEDAILGVFNR